MSWVIKRSGQTASTRYVPPSWKHWDPLPYMLRATEWLINRHAAGLPLKPGGRKTSITLNAFRTLQRSNRAQSMLIIAPLRVCRQTWRQEAAKWEQFKDLKFALLHGDKKEERLKEDADVWLINPEGVPWLCQRFLGRSLPFDVVCIDELTKFKNSQAERFKALLPRLKGVKYRWGLTGSLASNGYMDLFGMLKILDDGAALGKYITHFRDQYFQLDWDGFSYNLMPGAEQRIVDRISPYWFKMDDADYAQLPPEVPDPRELEMPAAARKVYDKMKHDMIASLPDGIITAANSAACYSKLSQMANGACYVGDDKEVATVIHEVKIEALDELVDELNGSPLLIGYEFNHDLERLKEWHQKRFERPLPYLGKGTTAKQEDEYIAAWNAGKLPVLAAHPASAGHGLNMQGSSAADICWFSITWDYELYDQLIRRIRRDGTLATQIFNHLLIVKGTIDELKYAALRDKELTQTGLYRALNRVLHDADTLGAGGQPQTQRSETMRLSRPGGGAPVAETTAPTRTQADAEPTNRPVPKGWGSPANSGSNGDAGSGQPTQRERIQENISGDQNANRSAFSGAVQEQARQISQGDEIHRQPEPEKTEATTTRRRRAATPEPQTAAMPDQFSELFASAGMVHFRLKAVEVAAHFKDSFETSADMFALADEIMEYASKAA